MTPHRRSLYFNSSAQSCPGKEFSFSQSIEAFHTQIKHYQPSPLVPLPGVAKDIGVKAVYAKNETNRLGLPAVNILGVSWAIFRALTERMGLPEDTDIEIVKARLAEKPVTIFTAAEGNHGRAVAHTGSLLGTPVQIHAPACTRAETIAVFHSENATVIQSSGDCDKALSEAQIASQENNGILIQEEAIKGYHDIPHVSICSTSSQLP